MAEKQHILEFHSWNAVLFPSLLPKYTDDSSKGTGGEGGVIMQLTKGLWFSLRPKWRVSKTQSIHRTWILVLPETPHLGSSTGSGEILLFEFPLNDISVWEKLHWMKTEKLAWTSDSSNPQTGVGGKQCCAESLRERGLISLLQILRQNFLIILVKLDTATPSIPKQKWTWLLQN